MPVKKISILGLGLIGGSIAKGIKQTSGAFSIKGYDKPEVMALALKEQVIDETAENIADTVDSDIIFLCLPSELSLKALDVLAPKIKDNTIITDVAGIKGKFEERWSKLKSKGIYIGGHPMTGKETGGYKNSDPLLFENTVYIISDTAESNSILNYLLEIISLLGARVKFLDPYLHDRIIAHVSHLPQLLSVILMNSTAVNEDGINYLDFAAGGFRDLTRIASSNFDIWKPIFKLNREEVVTAIERLHNGLNKVEEYLECEDLKKIESLFNNARIRRDEIPKNTKGFMNPLSDIFVYVRDEPGVLSKLTTLLYENAINIKDIELLKIREGTGGTFRISFDSDSTSLKAKTILENAGFKTK